MGHVLLGKTGVYEDDLMGLGYMSQNMKISDPVPFVWWKGAPMR